MSTRLDVALVQRGLAPTREKAKAAITAGLAYVNGMNDVKPSTPVDENDAVEVRGVAVHYVGRGGLKLEKALAVFGIDLTGAACIDVGASTGGFTDCMLQAGAARVTAIDVGHGQLDPKLSGDTRVTSLEGTDVRTVTPELIGGAADFASVDVSFISLGKVMPAVAGLLAEGAGAVLLVKPQFEAGPELVGKKGVVKDPQVHRDVLARVLFEAREAGLVPQGLDFSPIKGGEGNIEYLLYAVKQSGGKALAGSLAALDVRSVVENAYAGLVK